MKIPARPVLINIAIIVAIIFIGYLFHADSTNTDLTLSGMFIMILSGINFILGMIRNRDKKGDGPAYFLMSGIILLIGFSVCSV